MLEKMKVNWDLSMGRRTSIFWSIIYAIIMIGSTGLIIHSCIIPYHCIFAFGMMIMVKKVCFLPIFVLAIIYSAYSLAGEVRYLKEEES